ncbi:hypothetical protein CN383_26870 [Priestia megaterium]|uniref:hypothetical protein n=1 Tax=Priestia megaterium TaxID=1404 RepID=UPI000BF3D2E5|nr:hypothetical protein [Priestia megaterium]PFA94140.1 hypothetical protein CN383_26870 [Priestia megaterium]
MGIFTVEFKDSSGFDWKLLVDTLTMFGVFLGIYVGWHSYAFQKNRDYHEKRLDSVYAPLYGLLSKQELVRELYLSDASVKENSIIEFINNDTGTRFSDESKETSEDTVDFILDKKDFVRVLNESNKGLASPNLLRLLNEYEMLLFLEKALKGNNLKKAQAKALIVERELVKEIIDGYSESIRKLKLHKNKKIEMFNFKFND